MKKQTRRTARRARPAKSARSRTKEGRKDSAALDLPPAVFRKLGYRAVDILAGQLESLRDAALRGLCRRAAYRHDPKCLQHADPR